MKFSDQFKFCISEVGRMWALGKFAPAQIRHQLDVEEMECKLRAVCAEHFDVAIAWIEWRRDWYLTPRPWAPRRDWLDAARDEFEHACRYGPHVEPPHPDKLSELALAAIAERSAPGPGSR